MVEGVKEFACEPFGRRLMVGHQYAGSRGRRFVVVSATLVQEVQDQRPLGRRLRGCAPVRTLVSGARNSRTCKVLCGGLVWIGVAGRGIDSLIYLPPVQSTPLYVYCGDASVVGCLAFHVCCDEVKP